jgi:hypothetical protein
MPTANSARITLELELGADPIRGLIEHPDGSRQPFWGWLELMDELRRAATDEPEPAAQSTTPSAGSSDEREPRARSTQLSTGPPGRPAPSQQSDRSTEEKP